MLQLVLSPRNGWSDIAQENARPQSLMDHGFYPVLALVALTAFGHGLYGPDPFSYGEQLQEAIVQVAALFGSLMLSRALTDALLTRLTDATADEVRRATMCIYCLSLVGVIYIITNLCPIPLSVLWFLPAIVAIVAWQSREYLQVSRFKNGIFIAFGVVTVVAIPIAIEWLLGLII